MCLFKPDNCIINTNCTYALSYQANNDKVYLELYGKVQASSSNYIAVGFSTDPIMSRDSVIVCADLNDTGRYEAYLSYNPGKSNRPVNLPANLATQMIKTINSNNNDGYLYCLVERLIIPLDGVNKDQVFDLRNNYYILMASGLITEEQTRIHNLDPRNPLFPFVSKSKVDLLARKSKRDETDILSDYLIDLKPTSEHLETINNNTIDGTLQFQQFPQQQQPFPPQNQQFQQPIQQPFPQQQEMSEKFRSDMLKVHAILMVIAWTFFLPIGIFFAMFFKKHYPNTYIFGINIWFHMHRIFNLIGIGCTIAAFVCIFVRSEWRWVGPKPTRSAEENNQWGSVHAMLGLLACVVAWFQPIGAVFRCHPGKKIRFIFNIFHGFFGFGALLMAFSAIMIACRHFSRVFTNSDAALGIYIAYLCVVGVCFIILSVLSLIHWWRSRRNVTSTDMELIQSNGKRHVTLAPETIRTHRVMSVIFFLFILAAIGATVSITILIGIQNA